MGPAAGIAHAHKAIVRLDSQLQSTIDQDLGAVPALRSDVSELTSDFGKVQDSLSAIQQDFHSTTTSIEQLLVLFTDLTATFDRVVELLEQTAEHVENLDHKTGPPPPEFLTPER